ncbi:MAG: FkbM family methyltransferase [Chthoniobacterales bacterium]
MNVPKEAIRWFASKLGYDVRSAASLGISPFSDMRKFVSAQSAPVILDVGANEGQSIARFKKTFPSSTIHSFEPGRAAFQRLSEDARVYPGVHLWNCAVGASAGNQVLFENTNTDMSSFFPLSGAGWGKVERESLVEMTTIDNFLKTNGIEKVDILKSDTQGYDFEVLKGAEETMQANRIGLIYFEFIFSDMYEKLPPFDRVFRHLIDRNFALVSIYDFHHQDQVASFADMLFVNRDYHPDGLTRQCG